MGSTIPPWVRPDAFARPRSNTGAIVATVLVAVLVVAVALVGVITLTGKKDRVADAGYDYPITTSERRAGSEAETTSDATTTRRTNRTTTTTTTRTTRTSSTPTGPRPVFRLGDNPLFTADNGTNAVTCQLATWQTNPQGAADFFASALPCLEAAWAPAMQRAGLPYFAPRLEFPQGTDWTSPCGGVSAGAAAAFYCGQNTTIYMPFAGLQTEQYGARPGVYLAVFAHEFGHHIQQLSGVWEAYWEARYDAGADTGAGLELSRRAELQAQCFSGMFFAAAYPRGSVDDNILTEARTTQDRGDHNPSAPRDHGTDEHTIAWWEQGAQKNRTGQCNTWLAAPADVA
jgi:predicted metalloprotease